MYFKKFVVSRYKAIKGEITIDLEKNSLIPIIGINECGKTTILNSIFAFDHTNDAYNSSIKHLTDVHNLYETIHEPAEISAHVNITFDEFKEIFFELHEELYKKEGEEYKKPTYRLAKKTKFPSTIVVTRIITSSKSSYKISHKELLKGMDEDKFCFKLMYSLPFILYFDDFRDSFPDKLEIRQSSTTNPWLDIIEVLFKKTDPSYSIYTLAACEKRMRNNILLDVEKKLNKTLTKEWANFRLDDRDALEIKIEFDTEEEFTEKEIKQKSIVYPYKEEVLKIKDKEIVKHYLNFEVVETNPEGRERTFYVRDRSKGFYWFFNFVMKLEFNSKFSDGSHTIYLLDEPGSYLHPYAQNKLSRKLVKLAAHNKVLYCTHTHYLLDPDVIPLNTIHIAKKSDFGKITLEKFNDYSKSNENLQSAFQPIYDALYLRPFNLDFSNKKILIVEGIYDYYSFIMFRDKTDFGVMPGKGADSLINLISLMIGFGIDFKVLWDNDKAGNESMERAVKYFGVDLAERHFSFLPSSSSYPTRILQNLYDGVDIEKIKSELKLSKESSFNKVVSALFFSQNRNEIITQLQGKTKNTFIEVLKSLNF